MLPQKFITIVVLKKFIFMGLFAIKNTIIKNAKCLFAWLIFACLSLVASTQADALENNNAAPEAAAKTQSVAASSATETKSKEHSNKEAQNKEPELRFNVFEFKIDGNTVLAKGSIEEVVYPFLGEAKTFEDVEKARQALEKTYQDAGYLTVSVSIPQQEVGDGLVKLLVTEGKVERLRVTDSKYTSLAEVKSRVTEFNEGSVPNFPVAQQQLGTVNRGQNRQVTPILRPGKSPGKVEVDLKVQDQFPLHGSLELNDKYSKDTSHTRLNGSVRYENLWQKDHSIGISFQISPESLDETKVISGTYLIPRMNGDYFAAYGVISKSNISTVGDINVIGNGYIAGARYIHPLPQLDTYFQSLTFGADYKNFKETVKTGAEDFQTPISYSSALFGYDGTFQGTSQILGQSKSFQTQLNMTLNLGLRGLNDQEEFRNKRFLAEPNYGYLKLDIKHTQQLPYDWSLQAKLGGQLANDPLISAEQFTVGGADSVRGYTESAALGDNGVSASAELRTPPLMKFVKNAWLNTSFKELYGYTFLDYGHVDIIEPNGQDVSSDIASVGLGIKLKAAKGLFANLDYANALRDLGETKHGDDRLHFRLGYEW